MSDIILYAICTLAKYQIWTNFILSNAVGLVFPFLYLYVQPAFSGLLQLVLYLSFFIMITHCSLVFNYFQLNFWSLVYAEQSR